MSEHILIGDDHPLLRIALKQIINSMIADIAIHEVASILELQNFLEKKINLDLIFLDLGMPGAYGLSGLIFLLGQQPNVPIVIFSAVEDTAIIQKAIKLGAFGYIPKSLGGEQLRNAVLAVIKGKKWVPPNVSSLLNNSTLSSIENGLSTLTAQQFRVLGMVSNGMLNKQIAYDLSISEVTVKAHMTAIFRKLGVRTRTQAVIAMQALDVADKNAPE